MADEKRFDELFKDAMTGKMSRRAVLRRAALLGLSVPAISALLAACGGEEAEEDVAGDETATTETGQAMTPAATTTRAAATPGGTPAGTPAGSPAAGAPLTTAYSKEHAPTVPRADQASQFSGAQITYYGDSVGLGAQLDDVLAAQFTEDTGIQVNVVRKPQDATENFAVYQRFFQGQSSDVDVMMLDIIWPGSFAPHLVDLGERLSDLAQLHYDTIIQNNTVDGKLVAMPWFGDFGMLYYRTDLLEKYGFNNPPQTWDELEQQAQTIMEGEQGASPNFTGFVFQGAAYEGLTCNGLEWIASAGGGTIMNDQGEVTLDNEDAIAMLNRARGWVGAIAPTGVTSYKEEDARNAFQGGNAAFMRNWPYAYAAGGQADSPIRGMFDVAPLPANQGQEHYGTVGGWQLGVSEYSQSKDAAIEFVAYMTSPEVQQWRAVVGSYVPTIPEVSQNPAVVEAMPFLESLQEVIRVVRPSSVTGDDYNQVSTAFFQGVNQILNGQDASSQVQQIVQRIQQATR